MTENPALLDSQWQDLLKTMRDDESLGPFTLANIDLLKPQGIMGDTLIIAAPDKAVRNKVQEKKVFSVFKRNIKKIFNGAIPHFIIDESLKKLAPTDEGQLFDLPEGKGEVVKQPKESQVTSAKLNPKYTFENFIPGKSTRFAFNAAMAVAESPAKAYNPLFIYGGSGLGKTHLLHSIGHYALNAFKDQDIKVVYVSSEEYLNDFINMFNNEKEKKAFKNRYRNVDILLVDDIQFLAEKESSQEEFFHIFNTLFDGSKQVVISSDVSPQHLQSFDDRLLTRFQMGLTVDVMPPDLETRIAILRHKSKLDKISVPDDVIELIGSKIDTNIRELDGALTRVSALADLTGVPLDISLTESTLKDVFQKSDSIVVSPEAIIQQTADYFDLKPEDLRGKARDRSIAFPRQIAMYLSRELISDLTLALIGKEFGGRDHTTVMHAINKITQLMKTDKKVYDEISELTTLIKEKN
ncbi:MAG: chromosomal replication initiator protein DnaA [Micrococcaceae bacterium]